MKTILLSLVLLAVAAAITLAQDANSVTKVRLLIIADLGGDATVAKPQPSAAATTTAATTTAAGATTAAATGKATDAPVVKDPFATTTAATTTAAPPTTTAAPPTTTTAPAPPPLSNDGWALRSMQALQSSTPYAADQANWEAVFPDSLRAHIMSLSLSNKLVEILPPDVINSRGSAVSAVSKLAEIFSGAASQTTNLPDAIIVSESPDVAQLILKLLPSVVPDSVPVFVASPACRKCCEGRQNTYFMAPDEEQTAEAVASFFPLLKWRGIGTLSRSGDQGAEAFLAALGRRLDSRSRSGARVLRADLIGIGSLPTDDLNDEAALIRLAQSGVKGVVVAGNGALAGRVLSAHSRLTAKLDAGSDDTIPSAVSSLYFIFTPAAMLRFPLLPNRPFPQAVVAPHFTRRALFRDAVIPGSAAVGDGYAFLLSFLLDSINVIARAIADNGAVGLTDPSARIFQKVAPSAGEFTGPILFDKATLQRTGSDIKLIQRHAAVSAASTLFASWTAAGGAIVRHSSLLKLVPDSPLNAVTVCLMGSSSCQDVTNVNHALFALLDANSRAGVEDGTKRLPKDIQVVPRPINGGYAGVEGLRGLLAQASTCDFVIGPSRTRVMMAIAPVVNFYDVPVVDFGSTSPELSNKLRYPTFSRTVPTDAYAAQAFAAICKKFSWNIAAVLTTKDTYGDNIVHFHTAALKQQDITMEKAFQISDRDESNATMINTLTTIRDQLITRIIVVALPTSQIYMAWFFDLVDKLGMTSSHIFLLSDTMCQYANYHQGARDKLVGSFCVNPQYDEEHYRFQYERLLKVDADIAKAMLSAGGFPAEDCPLDYSDIFSPFAHDAALSVLEVIATTVNANGGHTVNADTGVSVFANGTQIVQRLRESRVKGTTGIISFDAAGDRLEASYVVNVMQRGGQTVPIATWNSATGYQEQPLVHPLVWPDNSTEVPKATLRSAKFIAIKTVERNPGIVVLSIWGFIVTIALAVFCYRHHKLKQQLEAQAGVDATQQPNSPGVEVGAPTSQQEMTPAKNKSKSDATKSSPATEPKKEDRPV